MAITEEQRAFRAGRIGSSDAGRIMAGHWLEVWAEKTGRTEPACLDFVPAVQIGVATEPLHARFYPWRTGMGCVPCERTYVHPEYPFLVAHPDYLTWSQPPGETGHPPDAVLEAKFHAGFKSAVELAQDHYWQIQHQMLVTGLGHAALSILRPGGYEVLPVPLGPGERARLLKTLLAFWWHVETDVEPGDPMPVAPPAFDDLRVVDMALHNRFSILAALLDGHRQAVLESRQAETEIKALMPEDARVAYRVQPGGSGVVLSRGRDGRLTLRLGPLPRKYRDRAEPWLPVLDPAKQGGAPNNDREERDFDG